MLHAVASPIAKVVVDLALDREFDYRIPSHLANTVQIGSRVAVPFGRTTAQGYVVGLADNSQYPHLKEIGEVVGKKPLLGDKILELTRWMGKYYCCPVELAVKCALPEVVRKAKISWKERQYVKPGKISPDEFAKLHRLQSQSSSSASSRTSLPSTWAGPSIRWWNGATSTNCFVNRGRCTL